MKTRKLGSKLTVSTIGLGCMGMTHAYGSPADAREMTWLMHEAVDVGYTHFDTAECYTGINPDGSTAYNEELVGNALKPYRNRFVIATKFGVRYQGGHLESDSRPETIRKSVEGSLKRLNTDYIDLYYQHRADRNIPVEDVAETVSGLIKEGKIRFFGVSGADEDYIRRAHTVCPLAAIQNRYSMMSREGNALFPVLEELNIGYVAFSPLANGILSGRYNKDSVFEQGVDFRSMMPQYKPEAFEENAELFDYVRSLARQKNCTPAQISLAWIICKKPFMVVIPGTRRLDRLEENANATGIALSHEEASEIDDKLV